MTTREQIEVMQAHATMAEIESRNRGRQDWVCSPDPQWNWVECEYRVKPTAPRRIWINAYGGEISRVATIFTTKEAALKSQVHGGSTSEFVEVVK